MEEESDERLGYREHLRSERLSLTLVVTITRQKGTSVLFSS